tara:strand:+ start:231 stop:869 length:639 start_codon:yes stop_codon:yes gene_type:complete
MEGLRTVGLSEGGGSAQFMTLPASATVSDALAAWTILANAHGSLALTYSFTWSAGVVTFAASGTFSLFLYYDLPSALGFSSVINTGSASYAGTVAPYALNPIGITYDAPRPLEEVKSRAYRFERQTYLAHHYANETTVDVFATTAHAELMLGSGLFAGRLRAYCDATAANAYSITNLTGYLDLYPFAIQSVETMGVANGHSRIRLLATLEGS